MTRDHEGDSPYKNVQFSSYKNFRTDKKPQVKKSIGRAKKYANVSNPSEITPVDGILIKTHHPSILIVGVLTKKRVRHDGTYTNTTIG